MRLLFGMVLMVSTSALGGTYMTYKPEIILNPGQCIIVGRNRVCAAKKYDVVAKVPFIPYAPPDEEVVYSCEDGDIGSLKGIILYKRTVINQTQVGAYLINEKDRCEEKRKELGNET